MAVTEGKIQVGDTDDFLDTTEVTQTDGGTTQREAVVITDPMALEAEIEAPTPKRKKLKLKRITAPRAAVLPVRVDYDDEDFIFLLTQI